jgi:hypothetical protein
MADKNNLIHWVRESLESNGGRASIVEISKYIWDHYENVLRNSGELFYTWQYDMRWAAVYLRKNRILKPAKDSPEGIWELK